MPEVSSGVSRRRMLPVDPLARALVVLAVLGLPARAQQLLHEFAVEGEALGHADVNGDGYADVLVGNPHAYGVVSPTTFAYGGSIRAYSGADGTLLYEIAGNASCGGWFCTGEGLGAAVAGAGDVNGDGLEDFLEASVKNSRLRSGLDGSVLKSLGRTAAAAGDVNLDGVPDQIVGYPVSQLPPDPAGYAEVRSGLDDSVILTLVPTGIGDPGSEGLTSFGLTVAGGQDLDADGIPDLLVAAPLDDKTASGDALGDVGSVWTYAGKDASLLFHVSGTAVDDRFGWTLAASGDVDGDSRADFIAGTHAAVYGHARVCSGLDGAAIHTFGPLIDKTTLVAGCAHDFNGDGSDDYFVGTPWDGPVDLPFGAVRVYSGSDGGLLHTFWGEDPNYFVGTSASSGDVDGDSIADIAMGSPSKVLVFSGLEPPWTDVGQALAGAAGSPALSGTGSLAPNTLAAVEVRGVAGAPGFLIVGLTAAQLPFKAGILVPAPDMAFPFVLDAAGFATLGHTMPGGAIDLPSFYVQAWFPDPTGPQGASASNALLAQPP